MRYLKLFTLAFSFLFNIQTRLLAQGPTIAVSSTQCLIDTLYRECLYSSENQVYQMMTCGDKASNAWDIEMEKYYKLLMGVLIKEEREKFREAQKQWLEYRDSEYTFARTTYYNLQGPVWKIVALDRKVEVVKHRALELKTYYNLLTEQDQ